MLTPPAGLKVFVATKPVDFRKGADGLALFAKEALGQDPLSGVALVFRSRRADRVKILVWDGSGLVLYWKRLENGAFKWPPIVDGAALRFRFKVRRSSRVGSVARNPPPSLRYPPAPAVS